MVVTSRSVGGWLDRVELEDLSDESYFLQMRACGLRVREWDDRYIGLLAGAALRQLPQQCGFRDIFHMAGVQARMSRKKVTEVLRISRAIRGCARLWRLFTRAEVAWTKIRAVAVLARPERDEELSWRVSSHTRRSIELWVRQVTREQSPGRGPLIPRPSWHDTPDAGEPRTSTGSSPQESAELPVRHSTQPDPEATRGGSDAPPAAPSDPVEPATPFASPAAAESPTREVEARHSPMSTDCESSPPSGAGAGEIGSPGPAGAGGEHPATWTALDPAGLAADLAHGRVATTDKVIWMLAMMGVDALSIEKLRRDREALPAKHGERSLVWVLEQAIRAYRPSGRSIKLTGLLVHSRCLDCAHGAVDSASGPLPVDDADVDVIRSSRVTVDLERELAASAAPIPPGSVPRKGSPSSCTRSQGAPSSDAPPDGLPSHGAGTSGPITNTRAGRAPALSGRDRPPVPARFVRFLMALQQGRCVVTGCRKPATELHHREPFDPARGHELAKMHLICRDHHHLVHTDGFENPEAPPWQWRARSAKPSVTEGPDRRQAVDRSYQEHLHAPVQRDEALARTLAPEARGRLRSESR